MSDPPTTSSFEVLARAKYVRLTTYKRDGTPVATPVWCAVRDGVLYASTEGATGKVKRLRHDPRVTVGACTARGKPTGPAYAGRARLLDGDDARRAHGMIEARYRTAKPLYFVMRLLRRNRQEIVGIVVEPATDDLPRQE
jgi:hypothetical protein